MKKLDVKALMDLLEGGLPSDRIELEGRVSININQSALLAYEGPLSIEPTMQNGEGHYFLNFVQGRFNFKPEGRMKMDYHKSCTTESGINYHLSALVIPIDLSPDAEIRIDKMCNIKY